MTPVKYTAPVKQDDGRILWMLFDSLEEAQAKDYRHLPAGEVTQYGHNVSCVNS